MSKWKQGIMVALEDHRQFAGSTPITGFNSADNEVLEMTNISRGMELSQREINKAVDAAKQLQDISDAIEQTEDSPKAEQIAQMVVESIYNKVGITKHKVPSLESFKDKSAVLSLEGAIGNIWQAIKKAVTKVIEMIKNFFKWITSFGKKAKDQVEDQKEQVKEMETIEIGAEYKKKRDELIKVLEQPGKQNFHPAIQKIIDQRDTVKKEHLPHTKYFKYLTVNANFDQTKLHTEMQDLLDVMSAFEKWMEKTEKQGSSVLEGREINQQDSEDYAKDFEELSQVKGIGIGEINFITDANKGLQPFDIITVNVEKAEKEYPSFEMATKQTMEHVWALTDKFASITAKLEKKSNSLIKFLENADKKINPEQENKSLEQFQEMVKFLGMLVTKALAHVPKVFHAAINYCGDTLNKKDLLNKAIQAFDKQMVSDEPFKL